MKDGSDIWKSTTIPWEYEIKFFQGEGDLDSNGLNFGNVGIFTALFVDSVEKKESEVTQTVLIVKDTNPALEMEIVEFKSPCGGEFWNEKP